VDYEDNKRLFITGTVVDDEERPISGVSVFVFVPISKGLKGGMGKEALGQGKTNTDGYFQMVTLSPTESNTIIAEMTAPFNTSSRPEFGSLSLQGIQRIEGQNADIRLQSIRLQRIVDSRFTIRRVSNLTDTIFYRVKTNPIEKISYLDTSLIPETFPDVFFATDTLVPLQNEFSMALRDILARDTLQLEYRLSSGPEVEVVSQKLVYSPETDSYVFEL
jgi:hypothetical protein